MTADEQGYNGWTNYPTWAVNLWLSNDEGLYNATRELVAAPIDLLGAESSYSLVEPAQRRRLVAANRLRHWVRDELAPDLGATFAADLLGYALDEVDWFEIAEAWLEDVPDPEAAIEAAEAAGYVAGTAAGSWLLDGNSSLDVARRLLDGIEDGDPAVLDELPSPPLSGEWAGDPTPRDVLASVGMSEEDDAADDVLTAYEDAFSRGVSDEAVRSARAMLGEESRP